MSACAAWNAGFVHQGIERFFIIDINNPAASAVVQSTLAVMWDAWGKGDMTHGWGWAHSPGDSSIARFNHVPGGSNVLYMDGHVEFVRYGEKYPLPDVSPGSPGWNEALGWFAGWLGGFGA